MISELEVMLFLNKRLGGVSTSVKDLIMSFAGYPAVQPDSFTIVNYKLTTQTIVLELEGIRFNDFRLDAKKFAVDLMTLMREEGSRVGNLRRITSKRFEIEVRDTANGPVV